MDIQLNLSTAPVKNKKFTPNKKFQKKSKPDAIDKSNLNFVQKPKIEGKIVARKRTLNQVETKKSTFSFLKNDESTKKQILPDPKQKVSSDKSSDTNLIPTEKTEKSDNDISLNVIDSPEKKFKTRDRKTKNDNFKQKDDSSKRDFKDRKPQNSSHTPDGVKKPTFKQISGLFRNNPEIPKIGQRHVKPIDEKLFSGKKFSDLNIHAFSVANLEKNLGLSELTVIQQKAVPIILQGRDVLIRSQTGSGKTLAYALPIIEALQALRPKLKRQDGIKALVIVPTRELALQTYELFVKLVRPFTWIVPGYLIGGENRKAEKTRIKKGINVLIGTPGRITDHIQNTTSLKLDGTRCLILDEADRLLDMGYEKDVSGIVQALETHIKASKYDPMAIVRKNIKENHIRFDENKDDDAEEPSEELEDEKPPKNTSEYSHELSNVFVSDKRQTVLLSATLTKAVETLAGLTMENPVFVDSSEERGTIIADSIAAPTPKKEIKTEDDDAETGGDDDNDFEIVPRESDDDDDDDDEDDEEDEDDSDSSDDDDSKEGEEDGEDSIKKNATIYKGLPIFGGLKTLKDETEDKNKKKKKNRKEKKEAVKAEEDSDSDYDFQVVKDKSECEPSNNSTVIITESGTHSNPFQNAVHNAIVQDEMVIPSSVNQIYMVIPMKLRLVTLGALIVEKCVKPGSGKMLVFMGTQDMIDYHCELLSRVLAGRPPKKFPSSEPRKQKKSKKDDDSEFKLMKLVEKEEAEEKNEEGSDADFEYDYDGIPLDVYEAKMRAEKAFVNVEFFQLHGSMDQKTRTEVFKTFRNANSGVLLCTDVAARGLDLPHVDCIVQYTGPISATDYVHRVGRTARAGNVGTAIMFLLPSEVLFVRQLEERRIRLHQEDMENTLGVLNRTGSCVIGNRHRGGGGGNNNKQAEQEAATALQQTCEDLVEADKELYTKACKAFTSWMRFYSTYPREVRAAFDRRALHAGHAAKGLGLRQTPRQIAKNAPKDKKERPNNKLSNQNLNQKREKTEKEKTERIPAGFDVRPTSVRSAKRDRMNLISEFDSGLEPAKKKKKK